MKTRLVLVCTVLAACSACAPDQRAAAPVPSAVASDTAIPGALPTTRDTVRNSDNQPMAVRTGLNSDPARPDGTPTRQNPTHYDTQVR
jgi:hypothetical protein